MSYTETQNTNTFKKKIIGKTKLNSFVGFQTVNAGPYNSAVATHHILFFEFTLLVSHHTVAVVVVRQPGGQ